MSKAPVKVVYTSAGGLGHTGIIDAILSNGEREIDILCGDIRNDCPASFFYPFRQFPPIKTPDYTDQILEISKEFCANVIVPNHTDELMLFSQKRSVFEENDIHIVVNTSDVLENVLDKGRCFDIVSDAGLPVPEYVRVLTPHAIKEAALNLGYPKKVVCLKPSSYPHGGSRGFFILKPNGRQGLLSNMPSGNVISLDEAVTALETEGMPELLVTEYLPGDEYSTYLLCESGKVGYCVPNLRLELMNSFSFKAQAVYNPKVTETASAIAEALKLDYCVNIQLKMNEAGVPCLVEVNPRFAGALCLSAAAGVNMPYLAIMSALGETVPTGLRIKWGTRMIRYWKEIFVP